MMTFLEFLKAIEYNTTGEVDGENNTDLEKPDQPKTRWWSSKKKCGLGGLPCSKYVAQMKKHMRESEEDDFEEPEEELRPGMPTKDGGHHEPEHEPNLEEFIANRFSQDYGETTDEIIPETGYLLSDGRCVTMGVHGTRYEDHRSAIPTLSAMKRWNWSAETIKQYEQSSRGYALQELLQRSGAARIHASRSTLAVDAVSLTWKQKRAIIEFITNYRPSDVVIELNGKSKEFNRPDPDDIEEYLARR
jgi:hypothetical protein